jgi:transmembrane protein TMEM260 (protein O-mannosyltransferase)
MPTSRCEYPITEREQAAFHALVGQHLRVDRLTQVLTWLVFSATLGLAITQQSLWMDEGYTVWFAWHKTFASFFYSLIGPPGTPRDPQMIFYLTYMWVWVKVFGASEWALRAANIPFAILFMGTMAWASRRFLRLPNLWVLFCLSPFFWFYLNEARPYVALMAFSAVVIVALLAYLMEPAEYKSSAPWCCLIALLLALGTHILAAFLLPSMLILMATTAAGDPSVRRNFMRDWSRAFCFCLPAFIALGAFYVWVSPNGVPKAEGEPGLANLAFVAYEFLGFGGLGPPRLELREEPHLYVLSHYWPWLTIGVAVMLTVGLTLFWTAPVKMVRNLAASLLAGIGIALFISKIEHFRVLDRHLAMFFPMLLVTLMLWPRGASRSKRARFASAAALLGLGIVWGISDARLVFLNKYEKDSYRTASSIAVARARSTGGEILWAADPRTARYYGVAVTKGSGSSKIDENGDFHWPLSNQATDASNWSLDDATAYLRGRPKPAILVLNKGDIFDTKGAWRTLIHQQEPTEIARPEGFSIYQWEPNGSKAGPLN